MSYPRGNGLGGVIWLALFCGAVGSYTLRYFGGIQHPDKFSLIVAGLVVFVVIVGLLSATAALFGRWQTWERCAHGIAGGKARGLCQKCLQEKQESAQRYQVELERKERQRRFDEADAILREQEKERLAGSVLPNLAELRQLTPQRFEDVVVQMFRRLGYEVQQTPYTNDYGRDAIMKRDGQTFLLECKRYGQRNLSGRPEIQKFHSAIISDKAVGGFFVSSGSFSRGAVNLAPSVSVELVDGHQLLHLMLESKPSAADDDRYQSVCCQCGERVEHRLRKEDVAVCGNGHTVFPTLLLDDVLAAAPGVAPRCAKCGTIMRLVAGRRGKFWGCSNYPRCRSTRPYGTPPAHAPQIGPLKSELAPGVRTG